jgi:hypothetical protein
MPLAVDTGWNIEQGFISASLSLDSKLQNKIIGRVSTFGATIGKFCFDRKLVDTALTRPSYNNIWKISVFKKKYLGFQQKTIKLSTILYFSLGLRCADWQIKIQD